MFSALHVFSEEDWNVNDVARALNEELNCVWMALKNAYRNSQFVAIVILSLWISYANKMMENIFGNNANKWGTSMAIEFTFYCRDTKWHQFESKRHFWTNNNNEIVKSMNCQEQRRNLWAHESTESRWRQVAWSTTPATSIPSILCYVKWQKDLHHL